MIKITIKTNSGSEGTLEKIPVKGKPGMYRLEGSVGKPKQKRRSIEQILRDEIFDD